tara:strand:- start:217 stop:438 length:222 start_codon:yes stop_codon:yes gene_type:complete
MKRLLLPLLAALALPTAVNAESHWLVIRSRSKDFAFEKIEMPSMEQCKEQGEIFKNKQFIWGGRNDYICLKGK